MFLDQLNSVSYDCVPSNFDEAWSFTWSLKIKFLTRNGYCELKRYEKHLKSEIGHLQLDSITPLMLELLKAKFLNSGLKPQSVVHILGLIGQVFNYLIQLGIYKGSNPASKLKKPKIDNSRHRYLDHHEAVILLDALKKRSEITWCLSLLSLTTGMRAGEMLKLRGEHVDLKSRTIRILDPKNGKNRTVYLPDVTIAMFQRLKLKSGRLVFTNSKGHGFTTISDTFARTVKRLGLNNGITDDRDKVVFHTLRHTFASCLAQDGHSLFLLSELLGHSSLEMTKRYSHFSPQKKVAATEAINSFFTEYTQNVVVPQGNCGKSGKIGESTIFYENLL